MSESVTKKDLAGVADGLREHITRSTREVIEYVNQSQAGQNERLDRLEVKVDAIAEDLSKVKLAVVDLLATDKHMHNLVRELQGQGITLDEKRIFAA